MPTAEDNITAALALAISTLNTLHELKVVTLEQAQQTVDHAIRLSGESQKEAVKATIKASIPAFVK